MSVTIKLGHNGHTRRLTHPDPPTWEWLATKVTELFKVPRDEVALSYVDAEEDQVTLNTQEELEDYFTNFHRRGETARFTVQSISVPPVTQVEDEDDVTHDPDHAKEASPLEAEEWHKVDADSKSHDVFGLESLWASLGGLNPNYFSIVSTPSAPSRFHNPDIMLQHPVNVMSPRSMATLIRMESDLSDSEAEAAEKSTPKGDKGKSKEVAFGEPTANVSSAQSIRGSEADPAVLEATAANAETATPAPVQVQVEDPPVLAAAPTPATPAVALAANAPDPPVPVVPSAAPPHAGNVSNDVMALLQALAAAFASNPELTEGVRKIIRLATDPAYLATQRDDAMHTANQAIAQAVSAAEDTTRGVSEALQEVFDTLSSSLNKTPSSSVPFGVSPRRDDRSHPYSPTYHRRGRWSDPFQPYRPPSGLPPHRSFPPPPPPPPFNPIFSQESAPPPPPPGPPPQIVPFGNEQIQWTPYHARSSSVPYNVALIPGAGPDFSRRGSTGLRMEASRPPVIPIYAPQYEASPGAPLGQFYTPAAPPGNQAPVPVLPLPAQDASPVRPYDGVWRNEVPSQTQLQPVPVTVVSPKEDAMAGLSERKTQLEIAKERYRAEKQKWKEEKEARRLARDREIERLTGRRVLSREDRRRERERRDLEMNRNIPQINAFVHNFSEREYDLDQKQPVASDLPADRDDRPTHIDGTVLPDGRFVPKPIHAKAAPAPPPYPSRVGHSSPAERRAQRLFNRLEDMGFSSTTHPRMREIVTEQSAETAPEIADEAILPRIMEAIVSLAPSGSGTHGRNVSSY